MNERCFNNKLAFRSKAQENSFKVINSRYWVRKAKTHFCFFFSKLSLDWVFQYSAFLLLFEGKMIETVSFEWRTDVSETNLLFVPKHKKTVVGCLVLVFWGQKSKKSLLFWNWPWVFQYLAFLLLFEGKMIETVSFEWTTDVFTHDVILL